MVALRSRFGWVGAGAVLAVGASLLVSQVRTAGGAPEDPKKATPAAAAVAAADVKLTKPWSELTTLSADQKTRIHEVHTKATAQISAIEKQEKADIMALLTDQQKTELKELQAKDRKEAAERRGTRRAAGPATAPAAGAAQPAAAATPAKQ
jgi:hypothetical protein